MTPSKCAFAVSLALALGLGCASPEHKAARTAGAGPANASASGSTQSSAVTARTSEAQPFVFDWAPPCRVPVVENVTRKEKTVRLAYKVAVRPAQNQSLNVFLEDFEIQAIEGQPISAEQREQLKPVLELTAALPFFEITKEGRYLRCEGLEQLVERMARQLRMPSERAEQLRKVMSSPKMAATMQESVGSYWATWVESWLAWDLAPHTSKTLQTTQSPGTEAEPMLVRREFLELRDGYASLQQTTTMPGKAAARLVMNLLKDANEQLGASAIPENLVKDARVEVTLYAETSLAGLRPRHTRFDKKTYFELSDGSKNTGRELRDVTWHWERAEGCGFPAR